MLVHIAESEVATRQNLNLPNITNPNDISASFAIPNAD